MSQQGNKASGLATAALVLGIIAIVGAWIPFLNVVSIILGVLALIFGLIPLFQKRSIGKAVSGVVLGLASIVIAISMIVSASRVIDDALRPTETTPSTQAEKNDAQPAASVFDGATAYDTINNGMTKEEVRTVAGVDPDSCSASEAAGIGAMESCTYGNALKDSVVLSVSYTDGVVTHKMKMGK